MERAVELGVLAEVLGQHERLPTAEELQGLIADLEVALILRDNKVPARALESAWYLHAVASADPTHQIYPAVRQRRAFAVSAHIFDLATAGEAAADSAALETGFAAAIGYMRGGLEPNATAMYRRLRGNIVRRPPIADHAGTLALEAGVSLLGLQTRELFSLFGAWRTQLRALAAQVAREDLSGTVFGTAEAVVLAADDLLYYLARGWQDRLERARTRLEVAMRGEAGGGDINARWVASHLLGLIEDLGSGSVWALLPPNLPDAAKQAFTLASAPILTLWEPQREVLAGEPSPFDAEVRRAVISVPTSAGKTLLGQLLMIAHVAGAPTRVCYIAPTRSLGREVRKTMAARLRILQKEVAADEPDFGLPKFVAGLGVTVSFADLVKDAAKLDGDDGPEVEVMTPERLSHLIRRDPTAVLVKYGLFVFDEAQLIGESGRGFTAESLLAYLHWRTRDSPHRIVLLSAAMGNAAQVMTWLGVDGPHLLKTSQWRGPRRLHAVYTTSIDWNEGQRRTSRSKDYPFRVEYPLRGDIRLRIADDIAPRQLTMTRPVGHATFKAKATGLGPKDGGLSTQNYKAAAQMIAALGHAGTVMVVTSTRVAAQRMAAELATLVPERADAAPLVDLARLQLGESHPLVSVLRHGVAFHHAALPTDVLEMLEDALREDRLAYLTCTSTLTEGVNLPVRTVVIAETRWEGQPTDAQISGARLVNALGRAGRAGKETEGWLVLVHQQQPTASDFDLLNPRDDELEVRSQLTSDVALTMLSRFEETMREAEDAVYREAGKVGDFLAFVWFVLAAEEELGTAAKDADVDGALRSTLGFHQLTEDQQQRWMVAADAARDAYEKADPTRRRMWARPGTSIGSARILDAVARTVAERVSGGGFAAGQEPESVPGALQILDSTGALERLIGLPERPDTWEFHLTTSTQSPVVEVGVADLMAGWLRGDDLTVLADRHLPSIADLGWRIEQLVDVVTSHFEHYLAWVVAVVVELTNEILESQGVESRLASALGPYIRYGVDSPQALQLMVLGVRSRRLAHVVAAAAVADATTDNMQQWLGSMSIPEWRERFRATSTEVLNLLDLARIRRRSTLRVLLEAGAAEVGVSLVAPPPGADMSAPAADEGPPAASTAADHEQGETRVVGVAPIQSQPEPRSLGVFDEAGGLVAIIPASAHGDVEAVLDTGLAVDTLLVDDGANSLVRITLSDTGAARRVSRDEPEAPEIG